MAESIAFSQAILMSNLGALPRFPLSLLLFKILLKVAAHVIRRTIHTRKGNTKLFTDDIIEDIPYKTVRVQIDKPLIKEQNGQILDQHKNNKQKVY